MPQQASKHTSTRFLRKSLTSSSLCTWMTFWSTLMMTGIDTFLLCGGYCSNSESFHCLPTWRSVDFIRKRFSFSAMCCPQKASVWKTKESRLSNSGLSLSQYKTSKCSSDLRIFIDNSSRDSVGLLHHLPQCWRL